MPLRKFADIIILTSLLIVSTAQKTDKKDTTDSGRVIAAVGADTVANRAPLSKEQLDAIRVNETAIAAGNNRILVLQKQDAEQEKKQAAFKSMAQTVKSLTYENVGYQQEIWALQQENYNLRQDVFDLLAQLQVKPDTVFYVLKPIFKKKEIVGYEKIRQ